MRKPLPKLAESGHQDMYPQHYQHPLVGVVVEVIKDDDLLATGVVSRVVSARHGARAILNGGHDTYRVEDCRPTSSSLIL